jgi:hypothetical protein
MEGLLGRGFNSNGGGIEPPPRSAFSNDGASDD